MVESWNLVCSFLFRLSPFANTKGRGKKKKPKETKTLKKWFSLIGVTTLSKKKVPAKKLQSSLFVKKQLHKTMYGFIVFEVEWANVMGMSYLNELQTDISLAIEAKSMRRWEFDSIDQAVTTMSLWFSGSDPKGVVFHDAESYFFK